MNKRDAKLPVSLGMAIGVQLRETVAVDARIASDNELMQAVSQVARAQLAQRWVENDTRERNNKARRVYYLSMEFLIGRSLSNALAALDLTEPARQGLQEYARTLEDLADREPDAALGNGGLGRLAACFLDSMATLGLPSMGYGIRYEYGMFAQEIQSGNQMEYPDPWLKDGTPWEFPRSERAYPVRFGGWVDHANGTANWRHDAEVVAKAYDMVIPGHGNRKVSTLRLWKAAAPSHID
ncbi:MAG: glycogen/starch/alpha-glucan phosphorylase, partial [Burkholderiaceae bacterium]